MCSIHTGIVHCMSHITEICGVAQVDRKFHVHGNRIKSTNMNAARKQWFQGKRKAKKRNIHTRKWIGNEIRTATR